MQNKKIAMSHSDLDGLSPIILIEYFEDKFDKIYFTDYKERDDEEWFKNFVKDYDEVVIVDFSPTVNELKWMLEEGKFVEIYDHHDSSEDLKTITHPNYKLFHDKNRCGTKIFFDEYFKLRFKRMKPILNEFVDLVNTYDLYNSTSELWEEAQNLNRVLYGSLNWGSFQLDLYGDFIYSIVNKLRTKDKWEWDSSEIAIIEKDKKKENKMFEFCENHLKERIDSKGNKFGVIHNRGKLSIICHRLLKKRLDLKYIIAINTYDGVDGVGWKKLSIRSRNEEEMNCLQLSNCKGHKCAAGSEVDIDFAKDLWMGIINDISYVE